MTESSVLDGRGGRLADFPVTQGLFEMHRALTSRGGLGTLAQIGDLI